MLIFLLLSLTSVDLDIKMAQMKARQDARMDAKYSECIGIFLPIISMIIIDRTTPAIPTFRLLDKSNVYMLEYSKTYRIEKRKIDLGNAIFTSAWSIGVILIVYSAITYDIEEVDWVKQKQ